jgi:VIT1/CCC1 family predicted Fe2+/Mn2+ transporter
VSGADADGTAGAGANGGRSADGAGTAEQSDLSSRLNILRAGVLGANDGIVSTAGLVLGVAATTTATGPILTAGLAGLVAGALSMASGEYVSVSTQRDTEQAALDLERRELAEDPHGELQELAGIYESKGLTRELAMEVAQQLHAGDRTLQAHAEAELGITLDNLTSAWHAAVSSALSFTIGSALPLIAILVTPPHWRSLVTFVAMLVALVVTGSVSARLGGANRRRAVLRVVIGGAIAMAVTYGIGRLVGPHV